MTFRALALATTLVAAPLGALAADWTLDPSHTQVTFSVNHLGFSETNGIFREFDADISFDADNIETSSVTFTIQAASIDTFWEARDNHVRGGDFLDVENHPEITFVSTGVTAVDDTTAELVGDLTIKGVTQPVTFQAELNQMGPNPFDASKQVAGFKLIGEIDRTAFGIDYGAPAIGTVIPVTIDLEIGAAADPA